MFHARLSFDGLKTLLIKSSTIHNLVDSWSYASKWYVWYPNVDHGNIRQNTELMHTSLFHQEMSVKSCIVGISIKLWHKVHVHNFTETLR